MKVRYFLVSEFMPDTKRTAPIGAWIVQESGGFDYVFSPDYPQDEQKASDTVNRILESGKSTVEEGFLEYWQDALGYHRTTSIIYSEDVPDYAKFYRDLSELVK